MKSTHPIIKKQGCDNKQTSSKDLQSFQVFLTKFLNIMTIAVLLPFIQCFSILTEIWLNEKHFDQGGNKYSPSVSMFIEKLHQQWHCIITS